METARETANGNAVTVNIAAQYTTLPGGRYRNQGPDSGERFREDVLLPAWRKAVGEGTALRVEMDGVQYGYPVGWLEEAFGGLARRVGPQAAQSRLQIVSNTEPGLATAIREMILRAEDGRNGAEETADGSSSTAY